MTDLLTNQPDEIAIAHVVLAHGAGAPMDTPFMDTIAKGLAKRRICVSRFEFPYMAKRRVDGKRRGPGSPKLLFETWRDVIREVAGELPLFIGGKSMGGRIASMVADEPGVSGVICLGYPFHPPGKPDKLRTEHLETIRVPALIVQGERDPFGRPDEVKTLFSVQKSRSRLDSRWRSFLQTAKEIRPYRGRQSSIGYRCGS